MAVNPKWTYMVMLQEINKLGNEEKMKSMVSKYMLDPKADDFVAQLGVCLLTEMRQELEKAIDWDADEDTLSQFIERRIRSWNEEELRHATVKVKSAADVAAEKEAREAKKAEKKKAVAEENKKRAAAKRKSTKKTPVVEASNTKVIGKVGGYTLEGVIS